MHGVLHHLQGSGLPVPGPLDFGDEVEHVTLVPGDAGTDAWAHQLGTESVRSAGRLLRTVHDATVGWLPPPDAEWAVPFSPGDVICHGDAQPANFAWRDGAAAGLFDWDVARPANRLSDVAYALEWFAPFEDDPNDRRARISAFLGGHGHEPQADWVAAGWPDRWSSKLETARRVGRMLAKLP